MKEPQPISYFSAHHANGSCTPSKTPGLKNSHNTTPSFVIPQANKALPVCWRQHSERTRKVKTQIKQKKYEKN
jgi:hypothetical protein